jgi:hypothetical protein
MKITITKNDIAKGLRVNAAGCPVARALIRAGFKDVRVYPSQIHYKDKQFNTPEEVANFIRAFDRGEQGLQPFSFELPVVKKKKATK